MRTVSTLHMTSNPKYSETLGFVVCLFVCLLACLLVCSVCACMSEWLEDDDDGDGDGDFSSIVWIQSSV